MFNWFKEKKTVSATPRMYVIIREDLAYKYVQGAHGLAQYALEHPNKFKEWDNQYLIYLSAFNGLALEEVRQSFLDKGIKFSAFTEPDLQSLLPTALCLFDNGVNSYRDLVNHLRLATK